MNRYTPIRRAKMRHISLIQSNHAMKKISYFFLFLKRIFFSSFIYRPAIRRPAPLFYFPTMVCTKTPLPFPPPLPRQRCAASYYQGYPLNTFSSMKHRQQPSSCHKKRPLFTNGLLIGLLTNYRTSITSPFLVYVSLSRLHL